MELLFIIVAFFFFRIYWVDKTHSKLLNVCFATAMQHLDQSAVAAEAGRFDAATAELDKSMNAMNEYDKYHDVSGMMVRFWIWDVEKLRK